MPLQIRRGTELQRTAMTVPLAAGELLFVTSPTNRIYVGDGTTLGGIAVTGYTDENAQDAVAPMFTGGSHSGINFAYNDASNIINATVDLSNYNGTIRASSFKGTLVADDSTALVDAVDGRIFLDGTVKGNIVPNVDIAYDLGSASYRFRDLYLSGSSIKLGAATITATGTAVNLPAGSTIGGSAIGTPGGDLNVNIVADDSTVIVNTTTEVVTAQGGFVGNVTGNVTGSAGSAGVAATVDITNTNGLTTVYYPTFVENRTTGQIVRADVDLTYRTDTNTLTSPAFAGNLTGNVTGDVNGIVTGSAGSSLTGNVTGNINGIVTGTVGSSLIGNTDGFHTGDVKGSVFADNSSKIIDAVENRVIANSVDTQSITLSNVSMTGVGTSFEIGTAATPAMLRITGEENESIAIYSRTDSFGDGGGPINFYGQSGTYLAPLKISAEGSMGAFSFSGYNGTTYVPGVIVLSSVATGTNTTGASFIKSNLFVATSNGTSLPDIALTVRHDKVTESPCFKATPFADPAARNTALPTPEAGMIVYITSTNKLQGYNGSGWQDLF